VSLGLNDSAPVGTYTPSPLHKSAGLAFGLSVLVPGAGQLYCGKIGRGAMTLVFWVLCLVLCFNHVPRLVVGEAIVVMTVLWVFSFLDAYFTAIEINKGQDDLVDGQNPRVAVTLNLLTAGFGYFYLGDRTKGIALFIAVRVAQFMLPSTGVWGFLVSLSILAGQVVAAQDAYRMARMRVKEALGPEVAAVVQGVPSSRLPVYVPVALACLVTFGFIVLAVIGLVIGPSRSARHRINARLNNTRPFQPPVDVSPYPVTEATPVPAVDLGSAALNVQQVQRKGTRLQDEDIPNLQRDVRVLTAALHARNTNPSNVVLAHYFRGVSLALINTVHYHEGEPIDADGAREALADFNHVVQGGPATARTYLRAVSISNAQYWAGVVARNHLHDEKSAYAYWEHCAGGGHAGCIHNIASAHITGEGGEKVDFKSALDLYSTVFDSGTRYHCAGALSAMNIAYINYFTGVKRPGDDELEWAQKADALWDKLEAAENNRNACERADAEIDEFLLQLDHGNRDDNILHDALSRLDENSKASKSVIQFISGAIDANGLEAAVQAEKSPGERCSAYFDAMWYAKLHSEEASARRYHDHLVEIGKFHCGEALVFARKFSF
jgi:TM2 domain-containing membrane protein YozV